MATLTTIYCSMAGILTLGSGYLLLLAWKLKDEWVLIIGGGGIASRRIESVLIADTFITIISPHGGLHPSLANILGLQTASLNMIDSSPVLRIS